MIEPQGRVVHHPTEDGIFRIVWSTSSRAPRRGNARHSARPRPESEGVSGASICATISAVR